MDYPHDFLTNAYPGVAVAFDFDGTLNHDSRQDRPGAPKQAMKQFVNGLAADGWTIVIHSARPPTHFFTVRDWLDTHGFMYDHIALGAKPSVNVYVDDKGLYPPLDALREKIELSIANPVHRWSGDGGQGNFQRQLGLCRENPAAAWTNDDMTTRMNFRIAVPCSGGLDSITALGMAALAGLDPVAYYVDTGASYSEREREVVTELATFLGVDVVGLKLDVDYDRYDYVDRGRNAIIVWEIAKAMKALDYWGEVWFGNVADVEETPVVGGDKTFRFFTTMQQLLTIQGFDVHLASPVGGMTKADEVRWWAGRGMLGVALRTRSCYEPGEKHCGRCRSCFRRWGAFAIAGHRTAVEATFDTMEWEPHAKELRENALAFSPGIPNVTLSPRRVRPWIDLLDEMGL